MSDLLAAVIVAAYIYLMIKGEHTISGWFMIGSLSILAMFIIRAIAIGYAQNMSAVRTSGVLVEICLGLAFLCLLICLPSPSVYKETVKEVKRVLEKAASDAQKMK